jgi:hypothetical protein
VVALCAGKRDVQMLVCGDHMGAVARFDGRKWLAISEDQVVEGALADMDVWRGVAIVLARTGELWRIERDGKPRPVIWDMRQPAFVTDAGVARTAYMVRGFDGGALIASNGGVIAAGSGDPVFHAAAGTHEQTRLSRIGTRKDDEEKPGASPIGGVGAPPNNSIVAMCGPHAWIWRRDAFYVIDLREW